jgi:cellulose biosynthesis protein BcsQ
VFSISVFNNKGGVGKTTLTFHLAHALALLGQKVLIVDLDPQCNLTILSIKDELLFKVWDEEDEFIGDFGCFEQLKPAKKNELLQKTRSTHFLLKATEDGQTDVDGAPPPFELASNIWLVPGRLTLHAYEDKIGERWSNAYKGDPLGVRTITQIRTIANRYANQFGYDYIVFDTSPSLGMLNRIILSMADGFIIPCLPDKFSLYGIRNIGNALHKWKSEFDIILSLQTSGRKELFPPSFVRFLGYTIYNARPYRQRPPRNKWDLAGGHFHFAQQIPETIRGSIPQEIRRSLRDEDIDEPIGGTAVMHTHNTLPNLAQKYHAPIWDLPVHERLEAKDRNIIRVNQDAYLNTKAKYIEFAQDVIERINRHDDW